MPTLITDTDILTLVEPTKADLSYSALQLLGTLAEGLATAGPAGTTFVSDTESVTLGEFDQRIQVTEAAIPELTLSESLTIGPYQSETGSFSEKASIIVTLITATESFTLNLETGSVSVPGPAVVAFGDTDRLTFSEGTPTIIILTGVGLGTFTLVPRLSGRLTLKPR